MHCYTDHDRKKCLGLRHLIADGVISNGQVLEADIRELRGKDLEGYEQVHLFAGIGGWPYALQLAGWPSGRPVWTGSCPCQPFSSAGKRQGEDDERHLWPEMFRLIQECGPATVFGEQVSGDDGLGWLDGVFADLEALDYACAAADICAASKGYPHQRQRLFFVADSAANGSQGIQRRTPPQIPKDRSFEALGAWDSPSNPFRDWREQLAQTRVDRLDDGISSTMVVRPALCGFGNAIVPQVGAAFVRAFLEAEQELNQET